MGRNRRITVAGAFRDKPNTSPCFYSSLMSQVGPFSAKFPYAATSKMLINVSVGLCGELMDC